MCRTSATYQLSTCRKWYVASFQAFNDHFSHEADKHHASTVTCSPSKWKNPPGQNDHSRQKQTTRWKYFFVSIIILGHEYTGSASLEHFLFKRLGECTFWTKCSKLQVAQRAIAMLMDKNVAHRCCVFVAIVWNVRCHVATRYVVIRVTPGTETDPGVAGTTIVLLIGNDPDPCLWIPIVYRSHIETFFVAIILQWRILHQ